MEIDFQDEGRRGSLKSSPVAPEFDTQCGDETQPSTSRSHTHSKGSTNDLPIQRMDLTQIQAWSGRLDESDVSQDSLMDVLVQSMTRKRRDSNISEDSLADVLSHLQTQARSQGSRNSDASVDSLVDVLACFQNQMGSRTQRDSNISKDSLMDIIDVDVPAPTHPRPNYNSHMGTERYHGLTSPAKKERQLKDQEIMVAKPSTFNNASSGQGASGSGILPKGYTAHIQAKDIGRLRTQMVHRSSSTITNPQTRPILFQASNSSLSSGLGDEIQDPDYGEPMAQLADISREQKGLEKHSAEEIAISAGRFQWSHPNILLNTP